MIFFKWNTIYGIIAILLLSSCTISNTKKLLVHAEYVMQNHPDSALILLRDSIDVLSLSYRDVPLYALLYTQACDKNYVLHTSDSLINIAVQYYKYTNNLRKAQAYFYQGSVYRDMERTTDAVDAFLKAKEELPTGYNTRFSDMINRNLALLYERLGLFEKGMEFVQDNYQACLNRHDSVEIMFPLNDIAHFYLYEGKYDSALIYYQQALNASKVINDSLMRISILYGISQTFYLMHDYPHANYYIEEAISISKDDSDSLFYYTLKGDILLALDSIDAARYFLKKGIHSNDIDISFYCAESLYYLEKDFGDPQDAFIYNDLHLALKDSLDEMNRRADALALINNHSTNKHTKQLLTEWKQERIVWIVSIGILIVLLLFFVFKVFQIKKRKTKESLPVNQPEKSIIDALQDAKLVFVNSEVYQYMVHINSCVLTNELNLCLNERQEIAKKSAEYFSEIIIKLKNKYALTDDDVYCFILHYLGLSAKAITTLMGITSDALRSRKKRIRRKLDEELLFVID
ncbi:tetratricopeptide repeat protein [Bacteroides sp. 519]|uniref:tetratricopeptide repeat protein n=1 Tax=Bacteroides sp. 519 TaxID=2302937 RepID=UPI0013D5C689|nr:tetratricopeptide repeat protein [Bacteroides sp. 519]NDV57703.1 tetratricopeptide repeat protein [Bacteroides sp. 519]